MLAVFLDIETTGLDPVQHAPIDIAFKVVDVGSRVVIGAFNRIVAQPRHIWDLHDPVSLSINGYTWEQVCQGQDPLEVRQNIIQLLQSFPIERGHAVFICQNPAFDRSFFTQLIDVYTQERLNWPYHWLDLASMFWTVLTQRNQRDGTPFPETLNLSKNEIAKHYQIPPEAEPHRAMNGVDHLMLCYQAVLGLKFENSTTRGDS